MECQRRLRDVDEFPIGVLVKTPTGRLGVVVAHKGAESRDDRHERCTVRYHRGGGGDRDTVTLLPSLLKLASGGSANRSCSDAGHGQPQVLAPEDLR